MATRPSHRAVRHTVPAAALCFALAATPAMVHADGGSDNRPSNSEYSLAKQAMDDGDYQVAIDKLTKLHEAEPNDADVLNLLGYGYRRIGNFDQSRGYYLQALAIDPEHRGANEYLGELYLETGELAKAEERLKVLDADCWLGCSEYTELKESIAKYKAENGIK
ncbi:MAG: tetratricopeptide repeat protein [Gammaproteobacteria bacterium]|nr:tetratricopeptide repeat protein [Gammaproteobacteria bacterium]